MGKVDPSAQQDASEYITQLVEQLGDHEEPFKRFFGGAMQSELLATSSSGEELRKKAGTADPFFYRPVLVKGCSSLLESLDKDIEGETLDGYKWNDGTAKEEKLPTQKRSYFQTLPPHLIFHLKRFEFDMSSWPFKAYKVNSRFEFPLELNLRPYTKEGLDDAERHAAELGASSSGGGGGASPRGSLAGGAAGAGSGAMPPPTPPGPPSLGRQGSSATKEPDYPEEYYMYELAGVVVQTGAISSGHYYSYIKTRGTFDDVPSSRPQCAFYYLFHYIS